MSDRIEALRDVMADLTEERARAARQVAEHVIPLEALAAVDRCMRVVAHRLRAEGGSEPGLPLWVTARRPDGWPLCPSCGDDELYSLEMPLATIQTIAGCYGCSWKPPRPHQETFAEHEARIGVRHSHPNLPGKCTPRCPAWGR